MNTHVRRSSTLIAFSLFLVAGLLPAAAQMRARTGAGVMAPVIPAIGGSLLSQTGALSVALTPINGMDVLAAPNIMPSIGASAAMLSPTPAPKTIGIVGHVPSAAETLASAAALAAGAHDSAETAAFSGRIQFDQAGKGAAADPGVPAALEPAAPPTAQTAHMKSMEQDVARYFTELRNLSLKLRNERQRTRALDRSRFYQEMPSIDYVTEKGIANTEKTYQSIKAVLLDLIGDFERIQKSNANTIAFIHGNQSTDDIRRQHEELVDEFEGPINSVTAYELAHYVPFDRNELNFWLNKYPAHLQSAARPLFEQYIRSMDSLESIVTRWERSADKPGAIDRFYEALKEIRAITPPYAAVQTPAEYDAHFRWIFQARLSKRFLDGLLKRPDQIELLRIDSRNIFYELFHAGMLHVEYASSALETILDSAPSADGALRLRFPREADQITRSTYDLSEKSKKDNLFAAVWVDVATRTKKGLDHFLSFKPDVQKLVRWFVLNQPYYWRSVGSNVSDRGLMFYSSDADMAKIRQYLTSPEDRRAFVLLASQHLAVAKRQDNSNPFRNWRPDEGRRPFTKEQIRLLEIVAPVPVRIKIEKLGLFEGLKVFLAGR